MNQQERLNLYRKKAFLLLGIPEEMPDANEEKWFLLAYQVSHLPVMDAHWQEWVDETVPLADERDELLNISKYADTLANALEHASKGVCQRQWGLLKHMRGKTGMDLSFLGPSPLPLLPNLSAECKRLSIAAEAEAMHYVLKQGERKRGIVPDDRLLEDAMKLAKACGKTKEDGLRLARMAYEASRIQTPLGNWGRAFVRKWKM